MWNRKSRAGTINLALIGGLLSVTAAQAQTVPVAATEYRIAPEDVLNIQVVNFTDLSTAQVVVMPGGNISVPLLGAVPVAGKSTEEVAQTLTQQWRRYVVNPAVTVSLSQKHKESVVVSGFVARPGAADYRAPMHVLEAIAASGDVSPSGDLSKVTVTHPDGSKQALDLSHPELKSGTDADLLLQPNDAVYVPERRAEFSVIGEVNRPGSFDYKENMTVLDALTAVGSVKETADLKNATLTHDGQNSPIDLDALLRQGDMSQNVRLAAGDRLMIPEGNRTYVYGSVSKPGYYTFKPGDRVLDALNAAGGPLQQTTEAGPDLGKVNLIRVDKSKNTAAVQQVNLDSFLKKGDMTGNVALQPGDVLFIPDKKRGFRLSDVFGVLQGLSIVNVGARVMTHGFGN